MLPHLHLLTLGAPLLLSGTGEQIRFRTRKHFALLIRLAVEAGRRLTRDYLMDLLWGNAPAHLARHSLAQALTVLKQKVGREHLLIQRAAVALVEGAVDADVANLDACDLQIRGAFLDGFDVPASAAFEQWKDEWRAKLTPRIRDCLVKQMDAGRRIGDFATVERHAQILHDLDPLSEDAVRGLIEARAWVGDRTNALKAFARFEADLATELGAKPSAELVRIADLLREGRRAAPRPQSPDQRPERQERRFESETLIGRERDFARLYDAWLEVRRRTPRIMVVTGDPGVGKTTLTNAFVSTCQMEGAVVARAQAYDAERELPFAILAELIKQLTLQRAIGGADPEALSELSRVSPEIFNVFPGVPKPVEWSAEVVPLRLADSFLKAVEAATDEGPLVLVVDDVHAADNASAAILHMVARKLPRTRLLLILTGRTNELRTAAAPSALVSDTTVQALQGLELEPLSAEAAERLVTALAVRADATLKPDDLPTTRILQAGNGNPLALELLTKEWVAHGSSSLLSDIEALNTQPVANIGIPRAIGAVFDRQIRRLDATSRAALDFAAVLGRRLADLPLYEVVGLAPAAAGEALTRLLEEGFLREVHGGLEFRNELIRAQAYYAIAGPARQHLHREAGSVLAQRKVGDDPRSSNLEVAWHFLRGGDPGRSLTYAIEGAGAAMQVGAPYESEQVLSALLHQPCGKEHSERIQLLLARALVDQSKADDALPILGELVVSAGLTSRTLAEVTQMRAAAIYLVNRDVGESHCQAAAQALAAARTTDDVELIARALFEYARSGAQSGDEDRVLAAKKEIDNLLEDDNARQVPILHTAQGFCHYFLFDARASAASLDVARGLLAESPRVTELSYVLNAYGSCRYHLCDFAGARQSYIAGLRLAKRVGDDSRASIISGNICALLTTVGEYDGAIEAGRESVQLGTRALNHPLLMTCLTSLAEAFILAGDRTQALDHLERAERWVKEQRSWSANMEFFCQGACVALLMGNLSLALSLIGSAEEHAWGKERCVPNPGVFEKLRVFRAAHVGGVELASPIAKSARAKFRVRHPLYYLTVLAAAAWLERRTLGCNTPETLAELEVFDTPSLRGYRALQVAQGFLT
ncbi:MAG: hypothetical protein AUH06_01015 [Gemmatimonadetes bacterium 13_2_20CM_69_27]|nr:MAG: hypothetical protein AUH06_01015 [Gemmatimonadetes bacterium 13_2_20CM_69_27]